MEIYEEHEKGWWEYFTANNMSNIAWFFLGGIAGTSFFGLLIERYSHSIKSFYYSALATIGLICLKELTDQVSSKIPSLKGRWGLDPAGGDWRDILLGLWGVAMVLIFNF